MDYPKLEVQGPHVGQPVVTAGEPLASASTALLLVHGRGADATSILALGQEVARPGMALLAPQAAYNTWYPKSFLAPLASNEPWLSSALEVVAAVVALIEEAGVEASRLMIIGFSQGACLASEFVARHARRYGGLAVLSGGVIGPDETPRNYAGSLDGTPVFMGCSDVDPHIPKERFLFSEQVFKDLGADVTAKLYPNMAHTVNRDELTHVRAIVAALAGD